MARSNLLKTEYVKISTTQAVKDFLEDLVRTGLYGKTVPEAAERLLTNSIQKLITEGVFEKRTPTRKLGR
ncbi:MAG TPA: hypothetical protein VIS96_03480 [Terrimicrobiaceae bacterium]